MKRKHIGVLSVLSLASLFFLRSAEAQTDETPSPVYAAIDQHALAAPPQAETSTDALAAYLRKKASTDLTKTRAIYRWIAANISYDIPLSEKITRNGGKAMTPQEVLAARKTVCGGYAVLFAELAAKCGLEAAVITGYSRAYGYVPGQSVTNNLHAWNAVRINGSWELLDCTWGSGYVDDKSKKFNQEFNEYYFQTPPRQLILTHFPRDPKYQFLPSPIDLKQFEDFVYLAPAFFRLSMQLDSHRQRIIESGSEVRVIVRSDNRTALLVELLEKNKKLPSSLSFVQRSGDRVEILAAFPKAGTYSLRLFGKRKNDAGDYPLLLEYAVVASGGKSEAGFPETLSLFLESGAQLFSPMDYQLKAGTRAKFRIRVPGAIKVAVITKVNQKDEWFTLKKGLDFYGEVPITPGEVIIYAKFPDKKDFLSLVKYIAR